MIDELEKYYKEVMDFCKKEKDAYNLGMRACAKGFWVIIRKYKKYDKK